jgi:mycothiol synthase
MSMSSNAAKLRSRPYRGEGDLEQISALLAAAWSSYGPQTYFHVGDIHWRMRTTSWTDRLRVWEDATDRLVAVTAFEPPNEFEFQVHPSHDGEEIRERILAWGEAEAQMAPNDRGPTAAASTWASERDTAWIELLLARGYQRDGSCCPHFLRPLDRPIQRSSSVDGFQVRSVVGEREVEPRVAVHREAFAPSSLTPERYLRLMRLPGYQPDLDIVAAAPNGAFAAFSLCWLDEKSRTGLLEPVGTHPDYRRLGLGRAVVLEGLRRLKAHGCECVLVVTGDNNVAALRLYESCGFELDRRDYRYTQSAVTPRCADA